MKNEVKKRSRKDDVEVENISDSEKISLSDTQMRVIEAILARRSVFFTGAAGILSHQPVSVSVFFSAANHAKSDIQTNMMHAVVIFTPNNTPTPASLLFSSLRTATSRDGKELRAARSARHHGESRSLRQDRLHCTHWCRSV